MTQKHPDIWVFPKNRGKKHKMDGENNGNPYQKWMIWVAKKPIFGETPIRPF